MPDTDFQARATVLESYITTATNLFNDIQAISTSQQANSRIATDLQAHERALRSELSAIQKSADAYNREFLDRKEAGEGTVGRLGALGLATTQDFVLAGFFLSYILASLSLMILVVAQSRQKGLTALTLLFGSIMVGILIAFTIMRFG